MKVLTIALALALLAPLSASAKTILIDGDTVDVDGTRIRIVGIDTPETFRPRCERELVPGPAAKERLRALFDSGPVTFHATGKDRYGRTLAHVYAGGIDVGQRLRVCGWRAMDAVRLSHCGRASVVRVRARTEVPLPSGLVFVR